ncbi:MAG: hypothetical protein IJH39_04055 [Clostridia bacterium]|nr:hypothetical protein [Clostridia bacterium]
MKLDKIKVALQKILAEFGQVTTDKGVLQYDGEELEVGEAVNIINTEEQTTEVAPDGEYYLGDEDGRTLIVENGVLVEIRQREEPIEQEGDEPADPDTPSDEPETPDTPDEPSEPSDEPETEDENNESGKTSVKAEEVENPSNEGEESDTEAVVKLREEVNELYNVVDELKRRIETLEGKPAAKPAQDEFKKIAKSGNEKLDSFIEKYCK